MLVLLSGAGLNRRFHAASQGTFTFRDEPHIGRAAMQLIAAAGSDAWVVAVDALDDAGTAVIRSLAGHKVQVRPILLFDGLSRDSVARAWKLADTGAQIAFCEGEAISQLTNLADRNTQLAACICARLDVDGLPARLISVLAAEPDAAGESADQVAARLGVGRATLFRQLTNAGTPRFEDLQVLFRLIRSASALLGGASAETASYLGGFSDASALRRALAVKLNSNLEQARERSGHQWIVDAWHAGPAGNRTAAAG